MLFLVFFSSSGCSSVLFCVSFFFFSSRRRHTRFDCDWSSDVCSSDLIQRLEVVLDLRVVVARDGFPGDGIFHELAILADDAEIVEARGHRSSTTRHVRVVAVLPSAARLALDADVVRRRRKAPARLALRRGAPPLARQQPLALAEVLALTAAFAAAAVPARAAALAVAAAPHALAPALRLFLGAHLVERLLHGLHRPVRLTAL